ncbi:MAG: dUTP diphosphatase, partial [Ilumatobacteraceae bacterium]
PAYAHPGDAGIDLHARESIVIRSGGGRVLMPTGIAVAIPLGWAGFVLPRSGLALKNGLSVVNSPGLIDSAHQHRPNRRLRDHTRRPHRTARIAARRRGHLERG